MDKLTQVQIDELRCRALAGTVGEKPHAFHMQISCDTILALLDMIPAFPAHKAAMYITHNEHKSYYQKVADHLRGEFHEDMQWLSEDDKQSAIQNDELWTVQVYPHTPIGFYVCAASSWENLARLMGQLDENGDLSTLPTPEGE